MITRAEISKAEDAARCQRTDAAHRLVVDETRATTDDQALIAKVRAAAAAGGQEWDDALARPNVNKLFARGVLRFGDFRR